MQNYNRISEFNGVYSEDDEHEMTINLKSTLLTIFGTISLNNCNIKKNANQVLCRNLEQTSTCNNRHRFGSVKLLLLMLYFCWFSDSSAKAFPRADNSSDGHFPE